MQPSLRLCTLAGKWKNLGVTIRSLSCADTHWTLVLAVISVRVVRQIIARATSAVVRAAGQVATAIEGWIWKSSYFSKRNNLLGSRAIARTAATIQVERSVKYQVARRQPKYVLRPETASHARRGTEVRGLGSIIRKARVRATYTLPARHLQNATATSAWADG